VVPDLICLRRGFGERVGEDKFELERGGCGDKCFVSVLPSMHGEKKRILYKKTGIARTRRNSARDCV
jgi:hypothetical protein